MINSKKISGVSFVTSWDDYSPENMRLAKLLKEFDIPATFFIETGSAEAQAQIRQLHELGFNIGCHGHQHVPLRQITLPEARSELDISSGLINQITGQRPKILAYPRGRYNDEVVELVRSMGFKYARTTKVGHTEDPFDDLITGTTVHVYSGRKEYEGKTWLEYALEMWKQVKMSKSTFHIWGHAWEMDRDEEWENLRKFFDIVVSEEKGICKYC